MVTLSRTVTPDEIQALTCESARLADLGASVTDEELDTLRDWKIDVLNRIALDPGPFADDFEAEEIQKIARREAAALRLGLPSTWDGATGGDTA